MHKLMFMLVVMVVGMAASSRGAGSDAADSRRTS